MHNVNDTQAQGAKKGVTLGVYQGTGKVYGSRY